MSEYFAVLDDFDRRGPFSNMQEPVALIKKASKDLGHTSERAEQFFLHQTAVEQVDIVNGKPECIRLGWQAREASGEEEEAGPNPKTISRPMKLSEREKTIWRKFISL